MDIREKINNLITKINNFDNSKEKHIELIDDICEIFDLALSKENISYQSNMFLYFISNVIGVPQYFELYCKIKKIDISINFDNLLMFNSLIRESSLYINKDTKLHIFQKEFIEQFMVNQEYRLLLTAPTSFGKTFIIYHLIEKKKYDNVVLIFPTISLMTENLQKIINLISNNIIDKYNVITLSEEVPSKDKNIFIFTPERFMSFIDKHSNMKFDFLFMDEIYKIDSSFGEIFEQDVIIEDKRDIAFRIALEIGIKRSEDVILAGPFLNLQESISVINFINDNNFKIIDYNDIELVKKKTTNYKKLKKSSFDGLRFSVLPSEDNNTIKILNILSELKGEETIIYCSRKHLAEQYALKISKEIMFELKPDNLYLSRYLKFIAHLEKNYTKDWCLVKALKSGIGIHHGTIPKYIQKEMINFFNRGIIKCIFSTTTITEGVNTTAKNMIILSNKKGNKNLLKFDLLNIMGRAGRFSEHFSGRVFILNKEAEKLLESENEIISHINYDLESKKSELDLEITNDKYLSNFEKDWKNNIIEKYNKNNIPENIRNSFLTIYPDQKIKLFRFISYIEKKEPLYIMNIIDNINSNKVRYDQIDNLIELIDRVIDKEEKLHKFLNKKEVENKEGIKGNHYVISYILRNYIYNGYFGLLKYDLETKGYEIDRAIRNVSKIVFNIFRYELVKYVGIIDLIYRTIISKKSGESIDEVQGFSRILSYLEYGAFTEKGRKISDFGVPYNVVRYIEQSTRKLDEYESVIYEEIKYIL